MNSWHQCKNLLVVRLDNMGDLLMSVPAINALKETFHCKISLLTSSAASKIASLITSIDEVIVYDVPWMKARNVNADATEIVEILKQKEFDAAVIFTVFSQNPLPSAMLLYLANIPLRLAYCRENPYALLTHWVPDEEPYTLIRHQVQRDLDLVKYIGAKTGNDKISINLPTWAWESAQEKMSRAGVNLSRPWLIFHPGVSETKRKYPTVKWVELARRVCDEFHYQVVLTGIDTEKSLTENIKIRSGGNVFSLAGMLTLEEFVMAINHSPLIVSVNTAAVHIAAATQTKVIVLYAMTNPQHTPWKVPSSIFPFAVPENLRSKNEVLRYVNEKCFPSHVKFPTVETIATALKQLLSGNENGFHFSGIVDLNHTELSQPLFST
jgi:lipopolysaccharide heptosyltransferase II